MKAYFVGSISGREKYLTHYKRILDFLQKQDVEVIEDTIRPSQEEVFGLSDTQKVDFYKQVLAWINQVDFVVAEVSFPSIGVGYEVSLALEKGKPVIAMHEKSDSPHFLEGIKSDKLQVIDYTLSSLESDMKAAIEFALENIDTRFNFFISPKISNYLDWVAKKKRTPRAVYLRRLIEKAMDDEKFEE